MLLLKNYTKFNMIKNIYRKSTKSNDSNILLIIMLSVILIIGMFAGLFLFSQKPNNNIIDDINAPLYPENNNNIENLGDIIYKNVNDDNFVYCPFKEGKEDDKDGVLNSCDNCPIHYNPDQLDNDLDGLGNVCDSNPNKKSSNDVISHISCNSNSDCGSSGFSGNKFCSNNNVFQLYTNYICMNPGRLNSLCISNNEQRTIQTCNLGCSNGQCISQPPPQLPQPPQPPVLTIYQCDDGFDNDGDHLIDFPADPGCTSRLDNDEYNAPPIVYICDDGIDNDHDGRIDYPADPGCTSRTDNDEYNAPAPSAPQCDDGIDNDHDGRIDYPADPQCSSRLDNSE